MHLKQIQLPDTKDKPFLTPKKMQHICHLILLESSFNFNDSDCLPGFDRGTIMVMVTMAMVPDLTTAITMIQIIRLE